jgi:hypothetical protein
LFYGGNCGHAVEEWKKVLLANNINLKSGFVSDEEISILLSVVNVIFPITPSTMSKVDCGRNSLTTKYQFCVLQENGKLKVIIRNHF